MVLAFLDHTKTNRIKRGGKLNGTEQSEPRRSFQGHFYDPNEAQIVRVDIEQFTRGRSSLSPFRSEKTYEATPPTIFATRSRGRPTHLSLARTARRSEIRVRTSSWGRGTVILADRVLEAVALGKSLRLVRAARSGAIILDFAVDSGASDVSIPQHLVNSTCNDTPSPVLLRGVVYGPS